MSLWQIAWRNLRVRLTKILFVLAGMVAGTALIVALFVMTAAMENQLEQHLAQVGSKVLLTPASQQVALTYRGITGGESLVTASPVLDWADVEELLALPQGEEIGIVAPKLLAVVTAGSAEKVETADREAGDAGEALALGVDFRREAQLKPYWQVAGRLPEEPGEVLLGHHLATRFKLGQGDLVTLAGQEYLISGLLAELGTEEDLVAYLSLPELQQLIDSPGQVSMVEISFSGVEAAVNLQEFVTTVGASSGEVRATPVQDAIAARKDLVERFSAFAKLVAAVVVVIGSLIMATTMLNWVRERTREIGIFRAMGFRQSHVIQIIFWEAGLLSLLAGGAGYLLGMLVAIGALPMVSPGGSLNWELLQAVITITLALLVGLSASIYPAFQAAKLDPVIALNHI